MRCLLLVFLVGWTLVNCTDLWEYPGYYWNEAYSNADTYWLSVYADDCYYVMTEWNESSLADTYNYNDITCYETLDNDFDNAISACESDSECYSMLLQIYYEDHTENLEHWGDHVAYLYKTSASLLSNNLTVWTSDEYEEIATTYVEKNEQEPLLASCYFVTFSISCSNYDAAYLMIPQWYYDNIYDPYQSFNDSNSNSIVNLLSNSEYVYQECDDNVLYNSDEYRAGLHYCIKSQTYTLIARGSHNPNSDPKDIELTLYVTQYGNTLAYWEICSNETKTGTINVTDSSTIADNDDCDLYQQTSYYSWIGDGTCDGELNKHPCYDGGDCCESTCSAHEGSELRVCGERGYHCIDPNATDYSDYLDEYSVPISVTINSDNSIDITIDGDSNSYSMSSDQTSAGYYITVIDHTSGVVVSDTAQFGIDSVDNVTSFIEDSVSFQQFVLFYGFGGSDGRSVDLVSKAALNSMGLQLGDNYDSVSDLSGESFIFLGRKGGNVSIPTNSYVEYIDLWKAYSYDITSFFQYTVQSSANDVSISATLWLDEDCEFSDLAYRYYVLDSIGASTFDVSGEFQWFSSSAACSSTTNSYSSISGKIAVVLDFDSCNSSLKIANAQLFGALGIVVINQRNDGIPNIVWYENESRGQSVSDITIPVIAMGFTDGAVLYNSLITETNTWRYGAYIYNYPNYTITDTRRCAAPYGLYEISECTDGSNYYYDNCTTCGCNSGSIKCWTSSCLGSRQPGCDYDETRVFFGSGSSQCCGECVEASDTMDTDTDDEKNKNKPVNAGKFTFSQQVIIALFSVVAVIILVSIAIVAYFQKDRYSTEHARAIVAGTTEEHGTSTRSGLR